tara:strand:+ start:147 stop:440 length:294 start_codon:yes stop_codon:yes gene_type:complete
MKSKERAALSKMTKKNLLLHIEKMQLMIENDHLETQRAHREMQDILSRYTESENATAHIQRTRAAAGQLRYDLYHLDLSPEDKTRALALVDKFLDIV